MIENDKVRIMLRKPLVEPINADAFPDLALEDIAWEGRPFTPARSLYVEEHLITAGDEDTFNNIENGFGIYQLSVYFNKGDGTEVPESLSGKIANLYKTGLTIIQDGITVVVDRATVAKRVASADEDKALYPISIYYRKSRESN